MSHTAVSQSAMLQDLMRTFHEWEAVYRRTVHQMDEAARFMERWRIDFKQQQKKKELPLFDRLKEWVTHVESLMKYT
ncbi:MAG TPA: hypothetical protein VN666_16380 [Nitrospira sp.]|nr:hypothetical protein [Nitrospira sp.]